METQAVLNAIRKQLVDPAVSELLAEVGKRGVVEVAVKIGGLVSTFQIEAGSGDAAAVRGDVRIATESTIGERMTFAGEAIFQDLAPGTGFSGFAVRGRIEPGDSPVVHVTARTNRYNVWSWSAGLRFDELRAST